MRKSRRTRTATISMQKMKSEKTYKTSYRSPRTIQYWGCFSTQPTTTTSGTMLEFALCSRPPLRTTKGGNSKAEVWVKFADCVEKKRMELVLDSWPFPRVGGLLWWDRIGKNTILPRPRWSNPKHSSMSSIQYSKADLGKAAKSWGLPIKIQVR